MNKKYVTQCGCGHRFPPKRVAAQCPDCGTIVAKNTYEGLMRAAMLCPDEAQSHALLARAMQVSEPR